MFEAFRKKSQSTTENQPAAETVLISIPEDSLHVMPTQYYGTPPTSHKQKRERQAGTGNPNKRFFLLLAGLAVLLGAIVTGFYFYAQYFSSTPTQVTNTPVTPTPSEPTPTVPAGPTISDLTTPEGRDAQRIKDLTTIQQALSAYQLELQSYPQVLSAIPNRYLLQEPKDPTSLQSYIYSVSNDGKDYRLQFVLESQALFAGQILAAGIHFVGPTGLVTGGQPVPGTATSTVPVIPNQPSPDALDADKDGLSAADEVSFKTNATNPDSDGDGYKDGDEILNLYSPIASGKAYLNASGLVHLYTNTNFSYSTWLAQDWVARSLDQTDQEIIFTAPLGDTITISAEANDKAQKIDDWYIAHHGEIPLSQTHHFQLGSMSAIKSPDGLSVYATNGTTIFSLMYQPVNSAVDYPTVWQLILATFKSPADNS